MISYKQLADFFGSPLNVADFQYFLSQTFPDITEYDITNGDYMISEIRGIELGFTNNEVVWDEDDGTVFEYGNPIFSHFTAYPKAHDLLTELPFNIEFNDNRNGVFEKAGLPTQTREGYADIMIKNFLVDNYKIDGTVFTIDYDPETFSINFIQMRSNSLIVHLVIE